MRMVTFQAGALIALIAAPAAAETITPRVTPVSAPATHSEAVVRRRIGALREQLGQFELQRLVDRITAEPAPAATLLLARIGPR